MIPQVYRHIRDVNDKLRQRGYTEDQIADWWKTELLKQAVNGRKSLKQFSESDRAKP